MGKKNSIIRVEGRVKVRRGEVGAKDRGEGRVEGREEGRGGERGG